ncbi:hypothetical protein ABKN59_005102 [Abortiporus biennis]
MAFSFKFSSLLVSLSLALQGFSSPTNVQALSERDSNNQWLSSVIVSYGDALYTPVEVDGESYMVKVDWDSCDSWLYGSSSTYSKSQWKGSGSAYSYGSSEIQGKVYQSQYIGLNGAKWNQGDYVCPNTPPPSNNWLKPGNVYGVWGVGPSSCSKVAQQYNTYSWMDGMLHSSGSQWATFMFAYPYYGYTGASGMWSIGKYLDWQTLGVSSSDVSNYKLPSLSGVDSYPYVPINQNIFTLDAIVVGGKTLPFQSAAPSTPYGQWAAKLSTTSSSIIVKKEIVDTIYGNLPGAKWVQALQRYQVDCTTEVDISITISGKSYYINHAVVVDKASQVCVSLFQAGSTSSSHDIILGYSFMANVYTWVGYQNGDWSKRYYKFLPITDYQTSKSEFQKYRHNYAWPYEASQSSYWYNDLQNKYGSNYGTTGSSSGSKSSWDSSKNEAAVPNYGSTGNSDGGYNYGNNANHNYDYHTSTYWKDNQWYTTTVYGGNNQYAPTTTAYGSYPTTSSYWSNNQWYTTTYYGNNNNGNNYGGGNQEQTSSYWSNNQWYTTTYYGNNQYTPTTTAYGSYPTTSSYWSNNQWYTTTYYGNGSGGNNGNNNQYTPTNVAYSSPTSSVWNNQWQATTYNYGGGNQYTPTTSAYGSYPTTSSYWSNNQWYTTTYYGNSNNYNNYNNGNNYGTQSYTTTTVTYTHTPTTTAYYGANTGYNSGSSYNQGGSYSQGSSSYGSGDAKDLVAAGSLADDQPDLNLPSGSLADKLKHCAPAIIFGAIAFGILLIAGIITAVLISRKNKQAGGGPSAYRSLHVAESGPSTQKVPLYGADEEFSSKYSDPYTDGAK